MIRTIFGVVANSARSCCQISSSQLTYHQSSHQYLWRRSIATVVGPPTPRLLLSAANHLKQGGLFRQLVRKQCSAPPPPRPLVNGSCPTPQKKLSLFQKFKVMYKDYWYVLVPVHVVTSCGWFSAFYQVSRSGVDLGYYLRKMGVSENVIRHITESAMGHIAVAWALYKVATPIRYAVTLGGTTMAINTLRNMGYIKPAKELMAKGRDKIQALKEQMPKK